MIEAVIDTSAAYAGFALRKEGKIILSIHKECQRDASGFLNWLVEKSQEAGISLKEISGWTCGIGPGSFTGIRVGAAFVKGTCFASNAKYRGENSGLSLASALPAKQGEIITVIHDGRQDELILNLFQKKEDLVIHQEIKIVKIIDFLADSANYGLLTTHHSKLMPKLEILKDKIILQEELKIEHLFPADSAKYPNSEREMEKSLEPIYVRKAVYL